MDSFSLSTTLRPADGDFLLLLYRDADTPLFPSAVKTKTGGLPAALIRRAPAKSGESATWHPDAANGLKNLTIRVVRLDRDGSSPEKELRIAVAAALAEAGKTEAKRVLVPFLAQTGGVTLALAVQEGGVLGGYQFEKYRKEKSKTIPVVLAVPDAAEAKTLRKELDAGATVFGWVNRARDLLNEPANVINPATLATVMKKEGAAAGLKVEVWDARRLKKENCGGILGVGAGAAVPPCLVRASYQPKHAVCHLALVGKGVTFDTGGYCLKTAGGQVGMKMDMGGAAMMFAAACAIARLKLPIRISLLTPLVENAISGTAYHTTDILRLRAGFSVQVDNTDAEGRLILADALSLAAEKKPDYLIDAATLTGACMVGLGEDIAGVFGTDSVFTGQLLDAAEASGEYMWELPLHQAYAEQLKTDIADCRNIGGSYGGSITAALFLQKAVPAGQKWIHVDIAGPAIKNEAHEHLGKGAKGYGVKSIVRLAWLLAGKER